MRILAIIANLLLLAAFGFLLVKEKPSYDAGEVPLVLLVVVAPVLSVVALMLRGAGSKDWLSRYFERQALQERRKLERLHDPSAQPAAPPNGGPAPPLDNSRATERPPSVS